jgi:hypothetical protein
LGERSSTNGAEKFNESGWNTAGWAAHFNPVLDNVGGGKTAGWVEKLTGEAEFKPVRDESSLVRLREGEEREGRRRESSRALTALGRRLSKRP